ncbi:hypothetical protein [Infirmifilum sp. SLHALR2]
MEVGRKKSPWARKLDLGEERVEDYVPPPSYDDLPLILEDVERELLRKLKRNA